MKITISKIPGVYPVDYAEHFYDDARAVREGIDPFVTVTAKRHKIVNDANYRKRTIQSVIYDKYTIDFITTESVDIDMMNYAGEVIITLDNGEQHLAEFIEPPTVEKLADSEFRRYTVTYRDLYSKKTINHLVWDETNNSEHYTIFKFNGGILRTKLYPDLRLTEWEKTSTKDNYKEVVNSEMAYKTIEATFYILDTNASATTGDLQNMQNMVNYMYILPGLEDPLEAITYMQVGTTKYIPIEVPTIEVEDSEMEGVIPVKVTVKYEQILNYPFTD